MKKKYVVIILIILLLFISCFAISKIDFKKLRGFIANTEMPADPAFDDIDFYKYVMNSGLNENSELNFISDRYIKCIKSLKEKDFNADCGNELYDSIEYLYTNDYEPYKVQSIKGIEKLKNLSHIYVQNQLLTEVDLSKNDYISYAYFANNNISKITLNDKIDGYSVINFDYNDIAEIDFNKFPISSYGSISINNNKLTTITIPNSNVFQSINANNNPITELNMYDGYYMPNLYTSLLKKISSSVGLKTINFGKDSFGIDRTMNITNENIKLISTNLILKNMISISDLKNNLNLSDNLYAKVFISSANLQSEITTGNTAVGNYVIIYDNAGNMLMDFNISKEFVNSNFSKYYIYSTIIDQYNNLNGTSYTTDYNLTDEQLSSITSLNITCQHSNVDELKGLEKLTNLNSLTVINYDYGEFDFSKLTKLTYLSIRDSSIKKDLDVSKLTELYNLSISSTWFNNSNIVFGNNSKLYILALYNNNLDNKSIDVSGLTNLNSLSVVYNGINEVKGLTVLSKLTYLDLSGNNLTELTLGNFEEIEKLYLSYNKLTKITFNNVLPVEELDFSFNKIESIDMSKIPHASKIWLMFNELKSIDFNFDDSTCSGEGECEINLIANKIETITGLENKTIMGLLYLASNNIKELDLSKTDLYAIVLSGNPVAKETIRMIKDTTIKYNGKLKLPEGFILDPYNADDYIINYDKGNITALAVGDSTITYPFSLASLKRIPADESIFSKCKLKVKVYDITTKKYIINKDDKYIYTGTETDDKVIKRYVKVYGSNAKKEIVNGKYNVLDDDVKVEEYDIIKVSSSKYDLDKDIISYTGTFDLNNIQVTNATKIVIENQLQILHGDVIVKTFELKENK